jgi:beta-glucanase (GH16 family)
MRAFQKLLVVVLTTVALFSSSIPAQALTQSTSVPQAKALTVVASTQALTVRWQKAVGTAKFKITGYLVTLTSGSWKQTKTLSATATSIRFSGLVNNRTYRASLQTVSGKFISRAISASGMPKKPLLSNSILFQQPADMFLGAEDQQLFALASGSTVIYTSATPSICTIVGEKVHAVALGDCIIRADSPADSMYAAAKTVEVMLTIANPPTPLNKTLLWSEEFQGAAGAAPSTDRWNFDIGDGCQPPHNNCGWGNAERQYYLSSANKLDGSADGILEILASRQTNSTNYNCYYGRCEWTSGKMTTYGKVGFTYGYMEARMKLPAGDGAWPAFWMLGSNINTTPWPNCGEIDIMEYKGHSPTVTYGTLHFAGSGGAHEMLGGTKDTLVDLSLDYHRYGMLWKPDEITFYIDDNVVYTARKSASNLAVWPFGPNAQGQDPSFYLILNLAMGGNFGGAIDANLDRTTLSVDWVRYYSVDGLGKVNNK